MDVCDDRVEDWLANLWRELVGQLTGDIEHETFQFTLETSHARHLLDLARRIRRSLSNEDRPPSRGDLEFSNPSLIEIEQASRRGHTSPPSRLPSAGIPIFIFSFYFPMERVPKRTDRAGRPIGIAPLRVKRQRVSQSTAERETRTGGNHQLVPLRPYPQKPYLILHRERERDQPSSPS